MSEARQARRLAGSAAVATGASRSAGHAVALELGAAGATVYVTGRGTRDRAAAGHGGVLSPSGPPAVPGAIEDTAEEVSRMGGRGVAVRCDHARDDEVRALSSCVEGESGGVDLPVNDAWGATRASTGCSTRRPGSTRSRTGTA